MYLRVLFRLKSLVTWGNKIYIFLLAVNLILKMYGKRTFLIPFFILRGISSTVRRCIEKETGVEFAAKIIDLSADGDNKSATMEEVRILRLVSGHPYISKSNIPFRLFTLKKCV